MIMEDIKVIDSREFRIDIYGQVVEVCITDFSETKTNARTKASGNSDEKIQAFFDPKRCNLQVVVHEAVHIAMIISERLNLCFSADIHEHFAYLVEFVFDSTWRLLDEMKEET